MMIVEPTITLAAFFAVGLVFVGIFMVLKRHYVLWSMEKLHQSRNRIQTLQQSFGALKEIKILARESLFGRQLGAIQLILTKVRAKSITASEIPRVVSEIMLGIALVGMITYLVGHEQTLTAFLPLTALYGAAVFRILPSMNRIMGSLENIRGGFPALDRIYDDLRIDLDRRAAEDSTASDNTSIKTFQQIDMQNIRFRYSPGTPEILSDVAFTIRRGESVGLVGMSGAGKTTLVDILLGLLTPDSGTFTVDGHPAPAGKRAWLQQLGYVPQEIYLLDDTLTRNIALGVNDSEIDHDAVDQAIKTAQLTDFINALPNGVATVVGERGVRISGGERQRIGIARALYHDPEIIVFDEATSSLDNITEQTFARALDELHGKKTIVLIAHRLSTVRGCDRLYYMKNGRVVATGSFDHLRATNTEFGNLAALANIDSVG